MKYLQISYIKKEHTPLFLLKKKTPHFWNFDYYYTLTMSTNITKKSSSWLRLISSWTILFPIYLLSLVRIQMRFIFNDLYSIHIISISYRTCWLWSNNITNRPSRNLQKQSTFLVHIKSKVFANSLSHGRDVSQHNNINVRTLVDLEENHMPPQ